MQEVGKKRTSEAHRVDESGNALSVRFEIGRHSCAGGAGSLRRDWRSGLTSGSGGRSGRMNVVIHPEERTLPLSRLMRLHKLLKSSRHRKILLDSLNLLAEVGVVCAFRKCLHCLRAEGLKLLLLGRNLLTHAHLFDLTGLGLTAAKNGESIFAGKLHVGNLLLEISVIGEKVHARRFNASLLVKLSTHVIERLKPCFALSRIIGADKLGDAHEVRKTFGIKPCIGNVALYGLKLSTSFLAFGKHLADAIPATLRANAAHHLGLKIIIRLRLAVVLCGLGGLCLRRLLLLLSLSLRLITGRLFFRLAVLSLNAKILHCLLNRINLFSRRVILLSGFRRLRLDLSRFFNRRSGIRLFGLVRLFDDVVLFVAHISPHWLSGCTS
nr:MAG TPA: hypothetical protein [Caudoviricetes sp.]